MAYAFELPSRSSALQEKKWGICHISRSKISLCLFVLNKDKKYAAFAMCSVRFMGPLCKLLACPAAEQLGSVIG